MDVGTEIPVCFLQASLSSVTLIVCPANGSVSVEESEEELMRWLDNVPAREMVYVPECLF